MAASSSKVRADSTGRVLEKVDRRSTLDDTLPIKATIVSQRQTGSHHEFVIRVQRGSNQDDQWDVNHRYSEFDSFNSTLQSLGYKFTLPQKTLFKNTSREFLAERQAGLQRFLDDVMKDRLLMQSLPVRRFLDPANYSQNFHDDALRNVSMFFRSNPEWSIVEPLRDIGWRIRKHYYLISSKTDPKQPKQLLSHMQAGPDFGLDAKELDVSLKLLVELRHPNILSPTHATLYSSAGLCVARQFIPTGSLRDKIYNIPPGKVINSSYLVKYSCNVPGGRTAIDYHDMRRYGRNILDGMKYLLDRGFVLGHVHCGNVLLVDDICKLTDLENCLMGIPPYYRQYTIELRKIQGQEAEAVYAFGHLLYEMACSKPLVTPTMDDPPPVRNDVISNILDSLLSPTGIKSLPSIADLLGNDFYKDVASTTALEKPSLRVPSRLKESLKSMRERYDHRLIDNQRKAVQQRRMSKAHDSLMSTQKKNDRRKKMKKELSMQETTDNGATAYPKANLKRHSTIGQTPTYSPPVIVKNEDNTSKSTSTTKTDTTKKSSSSTPVPAPPTARPPEPRPAPPPSRDSNERGALLGSIESFTKGKLKKTVTNDRSAPKL